MVNNGSDQGWNEQFNNPTEWHTKGNIEGLDFISFDSYYIQKCINNFFFHTLRLHSPRIQSCDGWRDRQASLNLLEPRPGAPQDRLALGTSLRLSLLLHHP